jgi:hypothetical protein
LVLGFGCLALLLVWFPILTPQNVSFDSRWYHLPLAEHYVAIHGIARFGEGWWAGAQPQLASLLYAWAFSAPGILFDRIETAAHMEFVVFVATLVGIAALSRRVLGERASLSWVAMFLFPAIFCYDCGLVLGADHVAAVFAAPIFLLAMRFTEGDFSRGLALVLGAVVAGALDTKYTAWILAPLPLVVVLAKAAASRARSTLAASGLFAASVVVLTAPHWLKNAVFYGDPLFPVLRRWLPSHPWSIAADAPYRAWFTLYHPPVTVSNILEMAKTLVNFSFVPHDWFAYHGSRPTFGSLFTLLTPCAVLIRSRRLRWLFIGPYLGIASWFWLHQFDRYLLVLVPWMAAATAVVLTLAWRRRGVVRLAAGLLVAAQVLWAGDIPFMPSHRAAGGAIATVVIGLLGSSSKDASERLTSYPEWEAMARALPPGAKVLIHEEEIHTGLSAATAIDYSGDQGLFYWGEPGASSPADVWRILRSQGVSHVIWADKLDHTTDTIAAGLVFFDFVQHHTKLVGKYGGFALAEISASPPSDLPSGEVAYYPCDSNGLFAPGLYPLESMARSESDTRAVDPPMAGVSIEEALERARFLVFDARCHGPVPDEVRAKFELLAARGQAMMLERKVVP